MPAATMNGNDAISGEPRKQYGQYLPMLSHYSPFTVIPVSHPLPWFISLYHLRRLVAEYL